MEAIVCGNSVQVYGVTDFCPDHIFDCGQAFRWKKDERGYTGVADSKVIRASYDAEKQILVLENCSLEDYHGFWKNYLDLGRDYGQVKRDLSCDPVMKEAVAYGWGMRVLNQDPWETLISFILSANNNITRIKGIIEKLSIKFGNEIVWQGKSYYSFPTPKSLACAEDSDLKECGCGYRGRYIKNTANMVASGLVSPYDIKEMPYEEGHKGIQKFTGVGDKVADCILLYSMGKSEAFPVDVWIKRVMEHFYIGHPVPIKEIKSIAAKQFGKCAGLAQQYLFYYAREQKIGK
ncbi:MAG: 8-oxoguanine DNA glycosylase [Clostridiales bacterium]|nr:8-oxoguanine DNA glycosylase [Clostridiales bacterium]